MDRQTDGSIVTIADYYCIAIRSAKNFGLQLG